MLDNLQLRYALDPWQVLTPEQNFTFFVPIDEAWDKVQSNHFNLKDELEVTCVMFRFQWL